ncbi:RTA1 like protein-domain-containing protein [Scheffersomyces xylosifermentans]|uniref:RTA1 like protein-domain-containing protein n=1 Tax=Scheffersomyces xylosifermentans TaxID=1304137 RepID=UPI00315C988C
MTTLLQERANDDYDFYHYKPIVGVQCDFLSYFTCYAGFLAFQLFWLAKSKSTKSLVPKKKFKRYINMMIPLLVGCIMEVLGYIARLISGLFPTHNKISMAPYIVQSIAILVAPTLFAATIYMCLGELIRTLKVEDKSIIKTKYLTKVFVGGDVVSFLLQGNGASVAITSALGGKIMVITGLVVQVIFFGLFCITQAILYARLRRSPNAICTEGIQFPSKYVNWRSYSYVLFASSILILIRSIYRTVEFIQGEDGSIARNQGFLYIFDSALMNITVILLLAFNMPKFLILHEAKFGDSEPAHMEEIIVEKNSSAALGNKELSQPLIPEL